MKTNKTRLFRHFITALHIIALSVPFVSFGYKVIADNLTNLFTSNSLQHHGGASDSYADDLELGKEKFVVHELNYYLVDTLYDFNFIDSSADDFATNYESYVLSDIVTDSHLMTNFDYVSLFTNNLENHGYSIAPFLFINYYINYVLTISLLLFLPEVILWFIYFVKNLIYKTLDRVGGD